MWNNITALDQYIGVINLNTSYADNREVLEEYASDYEQDILSKLLTDEELNDFDATLEKYDFLINGYTENDAFKIFNWNGGDLRLEGLKDRFCYLIYYHYSKDQFYKSSSLGDVVATPGNGQLSYNESKGIRVYNKFVDRFNRSIDFINYYNSIVPDTYKKIGLEKMNYINSFGI